MSRKTDLRWASLLITLLLTGCSILLPPDTSETEPGLSATAEELLSPADALPQSGRVSGWTPSGEVQVFDSENLYDLVDGQADAFFAYGFEQVAVGGYETADGAILRVEVWRLATPADAYGLYTTHRSGSRASIGNEADTDPGRRLDFWQERYFVRLFAPQPLDDAEMHAFAQAIASALPEGGAQPALLDLLPQEGLEKRSTIYFRQEISIQSHLWLGGQNLLALGPETAGVLARYDVDGVTAYLILVQYPDVAAATAGLDALESGQIDDLVLAGVQGNLLGAVFGGAAEPSARVLLDDALEGE